MKSKENNLAFVDGQNLYLGTKEDGWITDLVKFRKKKRVPKAPALVGPLFVLITISYTPGTQCQ